MIPLQALGLPEILVILVIFVVPLAILAGLVLGGLYLYRQRTGGPETTQTDDPVTGDDNAAR